MKRRYDEKTIGIDLLVHSELKRIAIDKGIKMKDLMMTVLTDYITNKINKND